MVQARAVNIKSGWKSLFGVFLIAASDNDESIVRLAFDTVTMIMRDYFQHICNGFFVDCVNCLIAYGNNRHFRDFRYAHRIPGLLSLPSPLTCSCCSFKAIEQLGFCAEQLANGKIAITDLDASPATKASDSEPHLRFWFPILTGLSCIVSHPHVDVRTKYVSLTSCCCTSCECT